LQCSWGSALGGAPQIPSQIQVIGEGTELNGMKRGGSRRDGKTRRGMPRQLIFG